MDMVGVTVVGMNCVEVTTMVVAATFVAREVAVVCVVGLMDVGGVLVAWAIVGGGGIDAVAGGGWMVVVTTRIGCSSTADVLSAVVVSCVVEVGVPRVISLHGLPAPHEENIARVRIRLVICKNLFILCSLCGAPKGMSLWYLPCGLELNMSSNQSRCTYHYRKVIMVLPSINNCIRMEVVLLLTHYVVRGEAINTIFGKPSIGNTIYLPT